MLACILIVSFNFNKAKINYSFKKAVFDIVIRLPNIVA